MDEDHSIDNTEIIEEGLREEEVGIEHDNSKIITEDEVNLKVVNEEDSILNRRGTPRRTIKKNKYFFDESMFNPVSSGTRLSKTQNKNSSLKSKQNLKKKKTTHTSSSSVTTFPYSETSSIKLKMNKITSAECSPPDQILGQKVGNKLKNLLKLPKAYRFVCCEFFYSNIDKPLFNDNDFVSYLKETFPQLKEYRYTRTEWCIIRKMMGKPRRCSSKYFTEERVNLERKRNVIRCLQQTKWNVHDIPFPIGDIPAEIPIQLVIGTKVTARVRAPQGCDGLFTGIVDAYDTSNHTYRVSFDRATLGTQSIPDYEVSATDTSETLTRESFLIYCTPPVYPEKVSKSESDSMTTNNKETESPSERPIELVENIIYFKKLLKLKKQELLNVTEMNSEAERKTLNGDPYGKSFQKKYACHILKLEQINKDINTALASISSIQKNLHSSENESLSSQLYALSPSDLQQETYIAAQEIVDSANEKNGKQIINNQSVVSLITNLTALMVQVKTLSHSSRNAYEIQVLDRTLTDIKQKLSASNHTVFEDRLAIHVEKIKTILLGESNSLTNPKKRRT